MGKQLVLGHVAFYRVWLKKVTLFEVSLWPQKAGGRQLKTGGGTSIAIYRLVKQGCSLAGVAPRLFFNFLMIVGLLAPQFSQSLQYVPPKDIQQLLSEVRAGYQPLSKADLHHSLWNCELLGAQTHLQKQTFDGYYNFSALGSKVINSGHHVVKSFELREGRLIGENEDLVEQIQLAAQGRTMFAIIRSKSNPAALLAVGRCAQNESETLPK
jgi:hypothetical protein